MYSNDEKEMLLRQAVGILEARAGALRQQLAAVESQLRLAKSTLEALEEPEEEGKGLRDNLADEVGFVQGKNGGSRDERPT